MLNALIRKKLGETAEPQGFYLRPKTQPANSFVGLLEVAPEGPRACTGGISIWVAGFAISKVSGTPPALGVAVDWQLFVGSQSIYDERPIFETTTYLATLATERRGLLVEATSRYAAGWFLTYRIRNVVPGTDTNLDYEVTGSIDWRTLPVEATSSAPYVVTGSMAG